MIRQYSELKKYCPQWNITLSRGKCKIIAEGYIKPDIDSYHYLVRIEYKMGKQPKITLLNHKFVRNEKSHFPPHIYKDHSLCVYYPRNNEWTSMSLLSDTILPWTQKWLFHYEGWRKTGKWHGGGTIHDSNFIVQSIESPSI